MNFCDAAAGCLFEHRKEDYVSGSANMLVHTVKFLLLVQTSMVEHLVCGSNASLNVNFKLGDDCRKSMTQRTGVYGRRS